MISLLSIASLVPDDFDDLEEYDQSKILTKILAEGKKDEEMLKEYLSEIGFGNESIKYIIYEAMFEDKSNWEDVMFHELQQLFVQANQGQEDAIDELSSNLYLVAKENMSDDHRKRCFDFVREYLRSPIPEVREAALETLIDMYEFGESMFTMEVIKEMQRHLKDDVFNVRIYAYHNLKEYDLVPPDFSFSLKDKLKAKLKGHKI